MLREHGVVGKFVEFYGPGVSALPLANRATIGNMSPEFGSTIAVFGIDDETIKYLELTGRDEQQLALVEAYAKEQGLWHDPSDPATSSRASPRSSSSTLGTVVPASPAQAAAGSGALSRRPPRPSPGELPTYTTNPDVVRAGDVGRRSTFDLKNGAVTIAAITSCTNTSNPSVMMAPASWRRRPSRRA